MNGSTPGRTPPLPLAVGAVLSDTFGLIRDRPIVVFGAAFLVTLPIRLWFLMLPSLVVQFNITSYAAGAALGGISSGAVAAVMLFFGEGALVSAALARDEGRKLGFLQSWSPAVRRAPMLFVIAWLHSAGILLGFICLVIPGVMLSLMWSVAAPVAAAEGTGVAETFRRSRALTDNALGNIFVLTLISGVGGGAFSWLARKASEAFFEVGANGLAYPFSPAPFVVGCVIATVTMSFDLALICSLYVALVRRDGGGPMYQRLNRIFE